MLIARFAQFQVQLGAYSALLHIPLYVYILKRGGGGLSIKYENSGDCSLHFQ